jgi:hypothetical protein
MAPRAAERTSEVREGDTAAVQRPLEPLIRRDTQEGRVRGRQQRRVRARVHPHGLSATRGQRTAPVRIGTARGFGRRFGRRNGTPLGAAAAGGGRGGTERTELWEERRPRASVARRAAACSVAGARAPGGGPAAPPSSSLLAVRTPLPQACVLAGAGGGARARRWGWWRHRAEARRDALSGVPRGAARRWGDGGGPGSSPRPDASDARREFASTRGPAAPAAARGGESHALSISNSRAYALRPAHLPQKQLRAQRAPRPRANTHTP